MRQQPRALGGVLPPGGALKVDSSVGSPSQPTPRQSGEECRPCGSRVGCKLTPGADDSSCLLRCGAATAVFCVRKHCRALRMCRSTHTSPRRIVSDNVARRLPFAAALTGTAAPAEKLLLQLLSSKGLFGFLARL